MAGETVTGPEIPHEDRLADSGRGGETTTQFWNGVKVKSSVNVLGSGITRLSFF
jgi:hypothetical protein